MESLREHAPGLEVDVVPPGGLHLWARLPADTDVDRVVRDCAARGVWVSGGDEWFPAEPSGPFLRLTFTGPGPAAYPEAARVIGEVVAGTAGA